MAKNLTETKKIEGYVIYNPKGFHYFSGYDGEGGYYSTPKPEEAYIFLVDGNARAMARNLKGKSLIVAHISIVKSVEVDFEHGVEVVADPI